MSRKEEIYYESSAGTARIRALLFVPEGEVKAVLQIAHGMTEYIDRYEEFAEFLCKNGIAVAGNDHLGHGMSVISDDDLGFFSDRDGNEKVLEDIYRLTKIVKEKIPGVPYFLMGHSMGSFYCRQYLFTYGAELDGAIIVGTGFQPRLVIGAGKLLASVIALFKGWRYRSRLIDNIAFGSYNDRITPLRTEKDWLTKDEAIVDKYIADRKCMFLFTLRGFYDMFTGIGRLHSRKNLDRMPKELPVLFASGAEDPVGEYTAAVKRAVRSFEDAGMKNVSVKFYEGDRHEILNETDRNAVYSDFYCWLSRIIDREKTDDKTVGSI